MLDITELYGHVCVRDIRIGRVPLQRFAEAGLSVELRLPNGIIILEPSAILSIVEQSFGMFITVSITQIPHPALDQELALGDVVYRIQISYLTNRHITEFGRVTLLFPHITPIPIVVQNLTEYIVVSADTIS